MRKASVVSFMSTLKITAQRLRSVNVGGLRLPLRIEHILNYQLHTLVYTGFVDR